MGIGQKIKEALHHDHPDKTYENDSPPGAFPSDTTHNKHKMNDNRDYTATGTTGTTGTSAGHTGTGLTGKNTTTGTTGAIGSTGATGPTTGHTGTGLSGKNTTGTGHHIPTTGPTNTHGGATGNLTDTSRAGHRPTDSGIDVGHGPGHRKDIAGEFNRTDERGAAQDPYWGSMGRESHGVTGTTGTSGLTGSNVRTGYDDPAGTHGPHANRAGNLADPRVDSDRDHRGAPHGVNKDLPLRPNEHRGVYDSNINSSRGQGPEAVGGGTYNPLSSAGGPHDPTSNIDRSIEGREFTHTGHGGNLGSGTNNQMPYGVQNPVNNPSLIGANNDDPYNTRMRDRDMGRDRTGHGLAGGAPGAALGVAASEASRRHHHDDIRDSGYGTNTGDYNPLNNSNNTRGTVGGVGGVDDYSRTGSGSGPGLAGHEPGVPKTSMLDPYNKAPTHGVGANEGIVGGHNGSPTFNQGSHSSNLPGMGPDHYGPGHEGAKVMHTCSHCGRDNDISRYFKKDAVYRMN